VKIDRRVRLRALWLLIIPFFWFAQPTVWTLGVGVVLAALGLGLRAAAAGFIHKDRVLTTTGPYAHTRNPLYLGSFLLGAGITVAGGQWVFVLAFLVFFAVVYHRTIRHEAEALEGFFGDAYREYAAAVPLFFPRPTPWRSGETASPTRFSSERWKRNREYEALLGAVAGLVGLWARMFFG
jgi:protein-S-isoprenylcysteine O-methyltransferase Ste14